MSHQDSGNSVAIAARDLARIGAESAESAFSLLADRDVAMDDVRESQSGTWVARLDALWECGVFFELEGCVDAVVGLMFQPRQRDALIERMMGEPAKDLGELAAESVMTEVANIVASHVASGIADASGGRLIPSLPTLVVRDAAAQLEVFLAQYSAPGPVGYSCELADNEDEIGALLLFVPRAES
jgi:chemotaxis protein CheY-P-specific phosphatase CheC